MLKFNEYLTEAKGAETSFTGLANEHFTNHFLNNYHKHFANHFSKTNDPHEAHAKAMEKINSLKYDPKTYKDIQVVQNAHNFLGHDEINRIHEDSKKTAGKIAEHLLDSYGDRVTGSVHVGAGGPKMVKEITGKPSQADILVKTNNPEFGDRAAPAILEHKGVSLKYSKAKSGAIKIHSPTVNRMAAIIEDHHKKMHGQESGLHDVLHKIGQQGLIEQQKALKPHHKLLNSYFANLNDPKLTYSPLLDKSGKHVGGTLSQEAVSHIRDSKDPALRAAYDSMAEKNLEMKAKMAGAIHKSVASVLKADAGNKGNKIKESLIRSMANVHSPKSGKQLPTMLVSTDRDKGVSVYDTNKFLENHMKRNGYEETAHTKGSSTFKAGPISLALDTRPTTIKNPVTSFPINTTVSGAQMKKSAEMKVSPAKPKKVVPAVVNKETESGLNVNADHGGRSFYTPQEKLLMKGHQ